MKILAIRGRNLTSFAGEFELALDAPPLDRLGLFAITGATGAGKSTLLDAMCLALFDRTPRLAGRGGAPVGRADEEDDARLLAYDVRGVLRRGAGEGFAEVDFLGRDGKRYRARWSVWRARNKAEGRFRPQEMSLTELAGGQQHGRTKGEVLAAIQERLGLSFDQFRRSALLAQGEFAAFLRADATERAELLERMTGTEVYSRVSVAAHEKNRQEQESLAKRAQGLAAIALLSDAEREAARVRLGEEELARVGAEARLREAEAAATWYGTRAEWVRAEATARTHEADAAAALDAAAPRMEALERARAAEAFRAVVTAGDVAERRLEDARSGEAARAREVDIAREESGARRRVLTQAEAERTAAVAADEAARPELEEATRLDARLAQAARDAAEATQRAEATREAEAAARKEWDAVQVRVAAERMAMETARAWLTDRAAWEALAAEWPRWQRELERYEAEAANEARARGEVERLLPEVTRRREAVAQREQEHQAAARAEEMAQAAATHADAAVGEDTGAARRALRETLLARRDALRALETAHRGARDEGDATRDAAREAHDAKAAVARADAEARDASSQRGEQDAALREARRALARAQATQGFASHRAALRDGEPCELCGATAHPYAREGAVLEGLVAESAARVEALEGERAGLERAEADAGARRAAASTRLSHAEERRRAAAARRSSHLEAWARTRADSLDSREGTAEARTSNDARGPSEAQVPEDGASPEAGAWLVSMTEDVRARLAAAKAEEEAAESRARAARESREALETQRTRREAAAEALRKAEELRTRVEQSLQEALQLVEAAVEARRAGVQELSPLFPTDVGWADKLAADPATFRRKCGERVGLWRSRVEAQEQARERLDVEQRQHAKAEAWVEARRGEAEAQARVSAAKDAERAAVARARAALLQGRSTESVRAALRTRLDTTQQAHDRAREAAESARHAETVAQARVEDAVRATADAAKSLDAARAELEARLTSQGTTLEAIRALLSRDAAWCEAEGRALQALREARGQAHAVLEERRARRLAHEATGAPALEEADVAATGERLRADAEARRRAEADLRAHLTQDDAARERHGAEARELEQRRGEAEVWKALSDLIGSHDGRKFKIFAQSLTLDALLLHANAHLTELARRYRLMRVPGHDLDLQVVDQDMGDEVRSVASLSGGESFLVSLALALGLASLSSETTQVETLFIDEGFGTLDPETLEVALATLDALQATGRQVGIISHVSGLAERLGVQVRVVKQGGGRSRLVVEGEPGMVLAGVQVA
ncbi:nuclease SbcCD subunit C [Corallococcus sp. H22C18031201]|nr:nuclease SbcCD subunit C [Corallococcus sp. H22C18031201]